MACNGQFPEWCLFHPNLTPGFVTLGNNLAVAPMSEYRHTRSRSVLCRQSEMARWAGIRTMAHTFWQHRLPRVRHAIPPEIDRTLGETLSWMAENRRQAPANTSLI
jgi:hypothetical protein